MRPAPWTEDVVGEPHEVAAVGDDLGRVSPVHARGDVVHAVVLPQPVEGREDGVRAEVSPDILVDVAALPHAGRLEADVGVRARRRSRTGPDRVGMRPSSRLDPPVPVSVVGGTPFAATWRGALEGELDPADRVRGLRAGVGDPGLTDVPTCRYAVDRDAGGVDVVLLRPGTGGDRHVHDAVGCCASEVAVRARDGLAEVVQRRDGAVVGAGRGGMAVSLEPAVRTVTVGAAGVARFWEEPAIIWYSSPSIISCSSTRFARALRSSNPWPSNWASQLRDSDKPKKRYLLLLAAAGGGAGRFRGLSRSHVSSEHIMTSAEVPRACSLNLDPRRCRP